MPKILRLRLIVGLALALSFPASAHAAVAPAPAPAPDTYPTVTFGYPIINQEIALANPFTNQTITVTPYIYADGNEPEEDSAVELRGYHLFYLSQNNPDDFLNLNEEQVNRQSNQIESTVASIVWDGDGVWENGSFADGATSNNSNIGYLVSIPNANFVGAPTPEAASLLDSNLTLVDVEDTGLWFSLAGGLDSLQDWIDFVDEIMEQNFFRDNSEYMDFHRQIGIYEGESVIDPSAIFLPLADSYFRVYGTPISISSAPALTRQRTNLGFDQSFYGSDYLSDPTGEVSKILKEINRKYGNLIIS